MQQAFLQDAPPYTGSKHLKHIHDLCEVGLASIDADYFRGGSSTELIQKDTSRARIAGDCWIQTALDSSVRVMNGETSGEQMGGSFSFRSDVVKHYAVDQMRCWSP